MKNILIAPDRALLIRRSVLPKWALKMLCKVTRGETARIGQDYDWYRFTLK